MDAPPVNLYLVGFAGSGKTTVGRMFGVRAGLHFLDSDHEIERVQGRPVAEIFAQEGEAAFRVMERTFVEGGHPPRGCVVACGGGLVTAEGMLERLRARGVVVCLHAPVETVLARTNHATHRPLFEGEDREQRVRALYAAREPIYRRADTVLLTAGRSLKDIVGHLQRIYRREAREWTGPRG